jgi:hypothetical protein
MTYRDTPIAATGASPSQLLMGRHLKTTLPVPESKLEPVWPDCETILARDQRYKALAVASHDRNHGVRPTVTVVTWNTCPDKDRCSERVDKERYYPW